MLKVNQLIGFGARRSSAPAVTYPLDGLSPTGAWSASRDLLSAFAGNSRYTIATGVSSWKDQSGNTRNADNAAGTQQPTITTAGPNSRSCLNFPGDSVSAVLDSVAISNFIAAGSGYLVVSYIADTINTNSANSYSNDQIIADTGGYMGLFLRNTGSPTDTLYAFNWDGNEDKATNTDVVAGTTTVAEWKHEGGNVYVRVNGGIWKSATSGNTQVLTGLLRFGTITKFDGKLFEAAIFSTVPSAANQDAIVADFMDWVGATRASYQYSTTVSDVSTVNGGVDRTFSSVDIGFAHANREVVVIWSGRTSVLVLTQPTVTIGGITATQVVAITGSAGAQIYMCRANVPTGTTANIVVNISQTSTDGTIHVYPLIPASGTPVDSGSSSVNATSVTAANIDVTNGGFLICGAIDGFNQTLSHVYNGVDTPVDDYASTVINSRTRLCWSASTTETVGTNDPGASRASASGFFLNVVAASWL